MQICNTDKVDLKVPIVPTSLSTRATLVVISEQWTQFMEIHGLTNGQHPELSCALKKQISQFRAY